MPLRITPSVAEQEGQQTETEATGAPQKHHYTLNQQVGSITGKVSSRIGLSSPARLFNPETDLLEDIRAEHASKPVHCVLVDESQFLTREQVHALSEVVDELDIPVLCYGLRTDFRGELFAGSQYLLAWSDKLVELKTICFCGRKASMVLRLDQSGKPYADGEQVVIGGNERYVSVCRKHYKEALAVGSLTALQGDNRK